MEFIMTIGLSGSGKTTWARNYTKEHDNCVMFDSDAIRGMLWNDENDQQNPAKVFDTMYRCTCDALSRGQSVIYCATNLNMKYRIRTLSMLRAKFPETTFRCVIFNTPIATCKEWNNARAWRGGRGLPEFVIDKQARQFQFPVENEGWDNISIVSPSIYETVRFNKNMWKDVDAAGSQDNPHHTLTLKDHLNATISNIDLSSFHHDKEMIEILVAAAIHDVGKAYTRSYDDKGVAHYFGHEGYGAYIAMNMGVPITTIQLVNYHMLPFNAAGINTWRVRLGEELWNKIMILHAADVKAK